MKGFTYYMIRVYYYDTGLTPRIKVILIKHFVTNTGKRVLFGYLLQQIRK